MNQLIQRLNRRKSTRRAKPAPEKESPSLTNGNGTATAEALPQSPLAEALSKQGLVESAPVENTRKSRRWRRSNKASSKTVAAPATLSRRSLAASPVQATILIVTPQTDASENSAWEAPWEQRGDPLHALHRLSLSNGSGSSLHATPPRLQQQQQQQQSRGKVTDGAAFCNRMTQQAADLDKDGNTLFERGLYDAALIKYQQALLLKKQSLATAQESKRSLSAALAFVDKEDNDKRRKKTRVASDDSMNSDNGSDQDGQDEKSMLASVATSINNMTYLKHRAGKASPGETMASYLKSLQMKRDILGPNHLSVGKTLNNIGSVFYLARQFDPALAAYKEAARIMSADLGGEHLDVGTVICNMGDVYCATGKRQEALDEYRTALPIRWQNLGPSDPKVVRLMEQISSLEMGVLPVRADDHLSDSEGEEFAEEDKRRHAEFKDDLRTLQRELDDDMKFFDILERQAAIDVVKDKTRVFREMREISEPRLAVTGASPVTARDAVPMPLSLPDTVEMRQVASVPLPVAQVDSNHTKAVAESSSTGTLTPQRIVKKAWVAPVLEPSPVLPSAVVKESVAPPVSTAASIPEAELTTALRSVGAQAPVDQLETSRVVKSSPTAKPTLSSDERKQALTSVRERLAKLRAARGYADPSAKTTKPIEHRSYMASTASSYARSTNPTRLFLGTPERQKVDEGMQRLRRSSKPNGDGDCQQAPTTA